MTQPPIFIFGVPRSGTTLLRTILDSHSQIACGPETPWLGGHQPRSVMELWRALREEPWGYCRSYGVKPCVVDEAARVFVSKLMEEYARSKGKRRWAEKTPDNALYVDFLMTLFPEARCVHLVRDGLDVAVSTSLVEEHRRGVSAFHEKHLSLGPGAPTLENNPFNALLKRSHWDRLIEQSLEGREHLLVRYEDLVRQPEMVLRLVMDFIGETFEPGMLDYASKEHDYPAWEWGSADVPARRTISAERIGRAECELHASDLAVLRTLVASGKEPVARAAELGSVWYLTSEEAVTFMRSVNSFAASLSLQTFTDWSKVWEYPWLWMNALGRVAWEGQRLVDLGTATSPIPWVCAMLGARVTLIETDEKFAAVWGRLRDALRVDVDWRIVGDEAIPLADASADVVTSFSVIEHQAEKSRAIDEAARVLRPGGLFCASFDICEADKGMTFPAWNGRALTLREFEDVFWMHPAFGNRERPAWNTGDIGEFLTWHRRSASHHNYVVGAAVMRKLSVEQ